MVRVEVEVIESPESDGYGVNDTRRYDGSFPMLKLRVGLQGQIMGEVVIETDARGIDEGVGLDVAYVAEDIAGGVIVNFAAAEEEVGVGVEAADGVFDFGAKEEVLLAADVASVNRIGAAGLKGRADEAKGQESEICSCGDAQVSAAFEIGECAGKARERG